MATCKCLQRDPRYPVRQEEDWRQFAEEGYLWAFYSNWVAIVSLEQYVAVVP